MSWSSVSYGEDRDSFARVRMSTPYNLYNVSMANDSRDDTMDTITVGSGATQYNSNQGSVTLQVSGNGDSAIRQSHRYITYQPGKSLLIYLSGCLGSSTTGVTKRVGYFDSNNGVFLQQTASGLSWVMRSYTSGAAVDTSVSQNSWNVDRLDGSGVSGITFDATKTFLIVIDLQWLGVGRVRCGFFVDGKIICCHQFVNTLSTVYMSSACLPVRYEITSTSSASTLVQICSSVDSEGGFEPRAPIRSISNGITTVNIPTGSITPILAIRLKSTYRRGFVLIQNVNACTTGNNYLVVQVYKRCTLTGGSWVSASTAVEYNVTMSALSGGNLVDTMYVTNQIRSAYSTYDSSDINLSSGYDGTTDILCIAANAFAGATNTASAAIGWKEFY